MVKSCIAFNQPYFQKEAADCWANRFGSGIQYFKFNFFRNIFRFRFASALCWHEIFWGGGLFFPKKALMPK